MGKLEGKVVFITGAGAGIARVAASLFVREGAAVALAEINEETGRGTERIVSGQGGNGMFIHTDITREDSVRAAVELSAARFGKIDILFNCAGGSSVEDGTVTEVNLDKVWKRTMELNLLGTILCCRYAIPRIIEAGGGSVINMSSGAALRGASPYHIYTAAKGAILSLTRAMAGTYATQNVRVNAISAGRVQTERNVIKYGHGGKGGGAIVDRQSAAERVKDYPFWLGESADIANIALFLATDESRMITGTTIAADGGRSAY